MKTIKVSQNVTALMVSKEFRNKLSKIMSWKPVKDGNVLTYIDAGDVRVDMWAI